MEEMKPPQCETPWKVKRSESCGDVHMEGFTEEAEETYTVELEGVVSPMNGSPLHDVTVVTEGDTPQRTDRMDTNDSNEKNEETKNSIPYNPNGGNGNGFFDLNEVLIEKRNAPHGVVHLGEEAPPNGLHKGDPCRGVKRWCSLGGREIVWNDFYTKGVFTPGKENSYGGEITPSVCTGSHTDQRPHPSESKENVKGTPSNEEVNKGKIPPHRNASYAYMKDETESPRLNCPSCEDNYSDVVTSHVESLKRCASHNNCEEQNQTGSKSFDRCSEGESRQMCSIFSRSVSCSMDQGKASTSDNLITTMSSCLSEVDLEIDMANMKREWSTQDGSKDRTFTLQGGEAEATCSEIMDRGLLSGEPNDEEEDFKDALEYELEHELQREIREEERQLERELEVELETDVKLDKVSYVKVNVDPYVDPDVVQLHAASSCASGGGNLNHEGASASAKEKVRNGSNCTLKEQYESMSYVEGQPGLPPQWQEGNAVKMHPNNTWNHSTSTKKGNQEIKTACKNSLSGKKRELVGDITVEEDTMRKRVAVSGISTKRSTPCKFQLRKKKSTSKMKKVYSSANPEKKKSRIVRLQKCVLSEGLRNSRSGPAKGGTPKSGIATKGIPVIGTVSSVKPHPLGKHLEALHRKDRDGTNGIGSIIDCTSRKGIPKTKTKMSCDRKKCLSKRHTISELRPVGGGNIISDIGGNTHAKALPDLRATKTSSKIHSAKSAGAKSILLHLPDTRMIVEKLRDFGKRHTISNATTDRRSREGIQTHSVKSRYGGDCLPKGGVRGMQVIPASRGTVGMISLKDDMKAGNGIRSSVGGVLTTQVAKWNGRHVETKARRNHNQVHRTCSEERNQKELIKNHVDKEFKGKEKSTFVKLHRGGESPTEEPTTIDKDSLLQRFNKTGLYANGEKAHVDHGLGSEDEIPTAAERKERVLLKKDFPQMWERGELDKHRAGERVQGYQDVLLHCLVGKDDPSHYRSAVSEKMPERVKGRSTRTVEIPLGKDYSKDKSVLRTDPHMVVTPRQLRISGKKRPEETPTGRRKENGRTRISSDELVLNRFLAKMGGNIPARVPKRESIKKGGSKSIQPNKVNAHVERRANVIKQKSSLCRSVVGSQRGNNAKEGEKERKKEETKKTKKNESRRTKDGVIKRGGAHVGGDREKYPNGVTPSRVELREGKKDSYLEKRKTYVFFLKKGLKGKLEKMNQKAEAEKHRKKVEGILQKRTEMSKSPTDANRSKKTLEGENPREEEQKKLYEKVYPGEPQDVPPLESKNLHGQMTTCRYTPHVNEKGKEVSFHSENNGLMNGSCHQSVRDIGVEVRSEVTSPRGNINLSDERKVVHFSHLDSKNGRSNHSLGIPSVAVSWKDTSNFHRNGNDGEMGHDIRPSSPSNAQKGGVQAPDVSFTGRGKDVPIGGNITQGYSPRGPYQIGSVKTAREGDLESFSRRTPTGDTRYADKVNLERSMEGEKVSTNRVACMSSYWDNPNDEGSHTPVAWRPMLHRRMVGGASKGERTTPMETDPMIASRTDTNVAGESATGGKKRTDGNAKRGTEGEKYNQNEPTNFTQHQVGTRRCSNDRTVNAHGNIKQEFLSHAKEKMKRLLNLNDEMQRSGEKNVLQVNSNMGSPSMWWSHLEQGTNTYLQDGQRKKKQSGNPCLNLKGDEMKKVFRSAPHLVHLDPSKVASNMAMSALSPRDITPGGVSPTVKAAQIVPCNVVQKEEAHTASPFSGHNNYPIAKGMNPNGPTLRAYQLPNTKPYGAQNVFVRCNEQKVAYPMGDASGRRSQLEKSKNDQNRVNRNDAYAQVLGTTYQGGTNRTYMSLHGPIGYTNPGQTKNNLISGEKKKNSNFSILWWKT
ncbi:Protein kinase [Plasmodium coatneyi]|uniref:Protein kinase n=1 Tax=Plasmodium coatneyi TaxID=208452 RepID=A0A1B1DY35_9APIC|nr:Protein kinase [Plasmodium coatneyi]ANQ07703.1 Protein kinase [Plasmodium coatneyi]